MSPILFDERRINIYANWNIEKGDYPQGVLLAKLQFPSHTTPYLLDITPHHYAGTTQTMEFSCYSHQEDRQMSSPFLKPTLSQLEGLVIKVLLIEPILVEGLKKTRSLSGRCETIELMNISLTLPTPLILEADYLLSLRLTERLTLSATLQEKFP